MKWTIRKQFKFEGAHVLDSSYSKDCQEIHGHSYIVEVFVSSEKLNDAQMVIDFGKLKDIIKPIIDKWDHAMIVSPEKSDAFPNYKVVELPHNPTAEVMAKFLFDYVAQFTNTSAYNTEGVTLVKIRIHETATGWAEYGY